MEQDLTNEKLSRQAPNMFFLINQGIEIVKNKIQHGEELDSQVLIEVVNILKQSNPKHV